VTYPGGSTYPITEWLIDGTWTDLSTRVRGDRAVDIQGRGRQNEQGTPSATTASVTMDNNDYALANRNPNSTYYRKIPPGTQVRHRAGDGDNHLYCRFNNIDDTGDDSCANAGDKAAFDIVGDLEVRVDIRPHTWRPAFGAMVLAKKYLLTGNQRSWVLYLTTAGKLAFAWSTSGASATLTIVESTVVVPVTSGRLAVKATIDVNNGAGGNTVAFYTAATISGTYTQLGTSVVTAGVTSIFSSTADLTMGGGPDLFTDGTQFGGRCYAMHLYSGIAGSRVADPDFSLWTLGQTSKADPAGNTWAVTGQARVTSPRVRFWGSLEEAEHVEDTSGNDVTVQVQAADLLQTLGTAVTPVVSPLAANITGRAGLLGWWMSEDLDAATVPASSLPGGKPGIPTDVTFGVSSDLPGAARVVSLSASTSRLRYTCAKGTGTAFWETVILFKTPSLPASELTLFTVATPNGTSKKARFLIGPATFRIQFADAAGTVLSENGSGFGTGVVVEDEWIAMRVNLTENGANCDWNIAWYQQGSPTSWGFSGSFVAADAGWPTVIEIATGASSAYNGVQISAVVASEITTGFAVGSAGDTWENVINGHAGESVVERMIRVGELADIYIEVQGRTDASALLGPQPIVTPLNVFLDAQRADGGVLYGLRDAYGVGYRTRQDLERHMDADLDYTQSLAAVPRVRDDGQHIVNDVTITRDGGSSARAQIATGPTSVEAAPAGVGPRPGVETLNVYTDDVLPDVANLKARYGSFDAPQIPNLTVAYHDRDPYSTQPGSTTGDELMNLDVGATVGVDGWPTQLPPERILFLVQGYQEILTRFLWTQTMNTTPAGPYQTGVYTTADQVGGKTRYGTGTRADGTHESTLSTSMTTTTTTMVVASAAAAVTTQVVWTSTSARYPIDVMVDGEQITLGTAPGGSTSPQTFSNVTRSVNGIVRAHSAGVKVDLYNPVFYGL
jgi:hypothetical protein